MESNDISYGPQCQKFPNNEVSDGVISMHVSSSLYMCISEPCDVLCLCAKHAWVCRMHLPTYL